jgi:hypothetical protein
MSRPFDLAVIDFEKRRKILRKRLLLISILPLLVAFLVGLKLLSLSIISSIAKNSYNLGDYSGAAKTYEALLLANWIESYKAPFNTGTSLIGAGDYVSAQKRLEEALPLAPPNRYCDVAVNLSLAIEKQADVKKSEKKWDDAIALYSQASEVLTPCSERKAGTAKERLIEKSNATKRERNNEKVNDSDNQQEDKPQDPVEVEDQLEKLKQQNIENNKKRQESIRQTQKDVNDRSYDSKPW